MATPKPTNKKCVACHKELPLDQFWNDRTNPSGKVARCKECHKSGNVSFVHPGQGGNKLKRIPDEITNAEVTFDFLADIKKGGKLGWQLPQVKLLLIKVQEANKAGLTDFRRIFAAYGSGRAVSSCQNVMTEIKKLAVHNREQKAKNKPERTLDEYWKGPREFKFGNTVVADAKSKKKK